jgi:hypothetical protein
MKAQSFSPSTQKSLLFAVVVIVGATILILAGSFIR